MAEPIFKASPGAYSILWPDQQVAMRLDRFADSHGAVSAEITISTTAPGVPSHLHHTRMNLLNTRSRKEVAGYLTNRVDNWDWDGMLEMACILTLEAYRQGESVQLLSTLDEPCAPEYLLWPILPKNQPTIIFGDGGVGKSLEALLLALTLMTGWHENPFGLSMPKDQITPLYLDWETDRANINWRLKHLQVGLGLPDCQLHYRRCYFPFADDLPEIQRQVQDIGAELLIIDSLGAAVGCDLNAPDAASKFLARDIRQLNITSLCLAHTAKNEQNRKTVYGSVFYTNYARSVWELKKHQEVGEDSLDIGLFCRKSNMSKLFRPLGFRFAFFDDGIVVESQQIRDVPELETHLPLVDRICNALTSGAMSNAELAQELNTTESSIRGILSRYKHKFVKKDNKVGLAFHDNKY